MREWLKCFGTVLATFLAIWGFQVINYQLHLWTRPISWGSDLFGMKEATLRFMATYPWIFATVGALVALFLTLPEIRRRR